MWLMPVGAIAIAVVSTLTWINREGLARLLVRFKLRPTPFGPDFPRRVLGAVAVGGYVIAAAWVVAWAAHL